MAKQKSKKKSQMNLIVKVLIGIAVGIVCGLLLPEIVNRILVTFSNIFSTYLSFVIPLMILAYVTMGIADLTSGAGILVAITVGMAYASTLLAGAMAYLVSSNLFPSFISPDAVKEITEAAAHTLKPLFTISIPPLFDTMAAVVLAFVLGLFLSATKAKEKNSVIYRGVKELSSCIDIVLRKTIIPLIPFFVMGTFANMAYSGEALAIIKILWRVFVVVIILHSIWILFQFVLAGIISKKNPFSLIKKEIPGYVTAIGTQSSAASIPVNLKCAENIGISEGIRNFTVPLCANVHMCGSMITIVCCSVAVLLANGLPISFGIMLPFMCTLGVAMVASPGAPGGSIMTALPFLPMIGLTTEAMKALMVSLYITQDSFGTACNVAGDNALGTIVDAISKKIIKKKATKENPEAEETAEDEK